MLLDALPNGCERGIDLCEGWEGEHHLLAVHDVGCNGIVLQVHTRQLGQGAEVINFTPVAHLIAVKL